MKDAHVVWLLSSAVCGLAIVLVRAVRLRRWVRVSDLKWRGVVGLSLIAGAPPAIAYTFVTTKQVEVPQQVLDHTVIPEPSGGAQGDQVEGTSPKREKSQ
jgi:hypothetical protein